MVKQWLVCVCGWVFFTACCYFFFKLFSYSYTVYQWGMRALSRIWPKLVHQRLGVSYLVFHASCEFTLLSLTLFIEHLAPATDLDCCCSMSTLVPESSNSRTAIPLSGFVLWWSPSDTNLVAGLNCGEGLIFKFCIPTRWILLEETYPM